MKPQNHAVFPVHFANEKSKCGGGTCFSLARDAIHEVYKIQSGGVTVFLADKAKICQTIQIFCILL
jgi:hypothetical protein